MTSVVVPNISFIMNRLNSLISQKSCCNILLELDVVPDYNNITNMWSYFKTISEVYKHKHKVNITLSDSPLNEVYKKYFNRYKIIKDVFESHVKSLSDHLILFYIKDNDHVLIFLKTIKNQHNQYNIIKIPFDNVSVESQNMLYSNMNKNKIKMMFYAC